MYIIVVGGGKVGANLMRSLIAMGHEVTLIEQRRDRFERSRTKSSVASPGCTRCSNSCSRRSKR